MEVGERRGQITDGKNLTTLLQSLLAGFCSYLEDDNLQDRKFLEVILDTSSFKTESDTFVTTEYILNCIHFLNHIFLPCLLTTEIVV